LKNHLSTTTTMTKPPFLLPILLLLAACSTGRQAGYQPDAAPAGPAYERDEYWAALPWKADAADLCPVGLTDGQAEAAADVFYLYPTRYTKRRKHQGWNAPLQDAAFNEEVQGSAIQFQASIFNGAGRVFSPYYRQAHLQAYFTQDTASARRALDLAYGDVRAAFEYYLEKYNEGRPIIIAAHSQGTTHAKRLLREFFDGQPLREQLVAAYLVGIAVEKEAFEAIPPCQDSLDTGCFVSWRTFRSGTPPRRPDDRILCTNPLLWTTAEAYAPRELNLGAVLYPFEQLRPAATDAQVHGNILWAAKPRFPGSFLIRRRNYHAGDLNFYYRNVRENARARAAQAAGLGERE
jgi:hypothetical protein